MLETLFTAIIELPHGRAPITCWCSRFSWRVFFYFNIGRLSLFIFLFRMICLFFYHHRRWFRDAALSGPFPLGTRTPLRRETSHSGTTLCGAASRRYDSCAGVSPLREHLFHLFGNISYLQIFLAARVHGVLALVFSHVFFFSWYTRKYIFCF